MKHNACLIILLFLIPQVVKKPGLKNKVKKLKSNGWSGYMSGLLLLLLLLLLFYTLGIKDPEGFGNRKIRN